MGLFFNRRNRKTKEQIRTQRIDKSVLAQIMAYAEKLDGLKQSSDIRIAFAGESDRKKAGHATGCAPYFLLIFAEDEKEGARIGDGRRYLKDQENRYLNSGYVAGQLVNYLQFLGIPAAVWKNPAVWMQQKAKVGEHCMAAVIFGASSLGQFSSGAEDSQERPCIFQENREGWAEEILAAHRRLWAKQRDIQVVCKENHICLMSRPVSARKADACRFEAGVVAAELMAAAEELWIDLVAVDTEAPRCLLTLCRREDRVEVLRTVKKASPGTMRPVFKTLEQI